MNGSAKPSSRGPSNATLAVVCILLAATCVPAMTAAARKEPDRVWVHPQFERFALPRIAVLPAVAVEGGLDICPFVEKRWTSVAGGARMRWLPTVLTRSRLKAGGHDSLLTRLGRDVLRIGRVDSTMAPQIAGALGVRGLLSLRVDLWRRENSPVRGRTLAVVGLTAALVDSSGTLLWSAAGREEHEVGSISQFTEEFGQAPADFDSALTGLVGRWGAILSAVPAPAPAPPTRGP